jgi:integrase
MITVRPYKKRGKENPKAWEYDLEFTFPDGTPHRERRKSPARTRAATQDYAEARLGLLLKKGLTAPPKKSKTLAEYWPTYLANMKAERAKHATVLSQSSIWKVRLAERWGALALDAVGPLDITAIKAHFLAHAPGTVNATLSLVSAMLKLAHVEGERSTPPPKIKYLRVTSAEVVPFSTQETARLLAACTSTFERCLLLLGLDAGLRAGEMAALRRVDIDLVGKKLEVRKNLSARQESTPKSKKGERVIHLTARLTECLREQLRTHAAPRVLFKPGQKRAQQDAQSLAQKLGQIERRAGLAVGADCNHLGKLHKLRHTFASRLAGAGATAKEIAELLGHTTLRQAEHYIHLAPEQRPRAISLLDAL